MINERIGTFGYNALDIAEYIIRYEDEQDHCINNLKLQKIMYFLQAQFVVSCGKSLFDEDLIAWDFGPIVKSVYFNYNMFGSATIFLNPNNCRNEYIAWEHRNLINQVLEYVRPYSTTQLVSICHNQSPWKNARRRWNNVISLYELKDYFTEDKREGQV
jgi:uncharacterized phage-associated protein